MTKNKNGDKPKLDEVINDLEIMPETFERPHPVPLFSQARVDLLDKWEAKAEKAHELSSFFLQLNRLGITTVGTSTTMYGIRKVFVDETGHLSVDFEPNWYLPHPMSIYDALELMSREYKIWAEKVKTLNTLLTDTEVEVWS
jgi:hypothetical protein